MKTDFVKFTFTTHGAYEMIKISVSGKVSCAKCTYFRQNKYKTCAKLFC